MRVITLTIVESKPGELELSLDRQGEIATVKVECSSAETVKSLRGDPSFLEGFLTPALVRALHQWVMNEPGNSILAVVCELTELDGIPWEHLPQVLEMRSICVVRQSRPKNPIPHSSAEDAPVLMAAGWSGKPRFNLPGIFEELRALGNLCAAAGRPAQVLSDPTLEELTSACASFKPSVLHLVPPVIDTSSGNPMVVLSGADDVQFVESDRFLSILPEDHHLHLVIVNSCSSGAGKQGPSLTRMIVERWSTIVIGWLGLIDDLAATDFTRFLYSRLLEGQLLSEVIRAYALLQSSTLIADLRARDLTPAEHVAIYNPVPVIWTQDVAAVAEPVFPLRATTIESTDPGETVVRAAGGRVTRGSSAVKPKKAIPPGSQQTVAEEAEIAPPRLELEFEPQLWLNPALLKNGRPAITRLVLNPDRSLRNVELVVTCDTGNGVSAVRQTIDLGRGPQPVPTADRQFPALFELIEAGVPRRQINFTVTCRWEGRLLAERTMPVLWMGRAEWLDQKETWHYIPAFVNPYDDGVLDVLDEADAILKTIEGPTSSFSGYQDNDEEHVMKQVEALFNCLRDKFMLSYISPPPVSVFLPGASQSSGQRVRRPEEVIKRKRGTCHDLSVLLAGCMEHIGINPLVYLIRGHTFVGFWKSDKTHVDFWDEARAKKLRLPQVPGRDWIMTDLPEIQELIKQKTVVSVEATKVTNKNATFAEALKDGSKHWQDKLLELQPFDVAIDVLASRRLVQPL